eukprot:1155843-Pelagomonas_calceolata.AAC.7
MLHPTATNDLQAYRYIQPADAWLATHQTLGSCFPLAPSLIQAGPVSLHGEALARLTWLA